MAEENSSEKVIKGIKSFIYNMPSVGNGIYVIQQSTIAGYGSGQAAYDALKRDFDQLDLSLNLEDIELKKRIRRDKKEVVALELKLSELTSIFGEEKEVSKGSLAYQFVSKLELEIKGLIKQRDDLGQEVILLEEDKKNKIEKFNDRVEFERLKALSDVKRAKETASRQVTIIEQFSDFLSETNKNMRLYHYVIITLLLIVLLAVGLSIPDLLSCFESYDTFITKLGAKASTWQMINLALGFLIVKLPWAFVISAIFTGFYRLIKSLLITYEKINQDKRNMSAIYAVSGNIAQSLNEYGLGIVEANTIEEDGTVETIVVRISNKDLHQKKESLKWNQIMNYFERMQQYKEDPVKDKDNNSKSLIKLASKAIDKIPIVK
jgi:hypothetical protein